MSDTSQVKILLHIVPSTDEDDDMETLSLVEEVRRDVLKEVSQHNTYRAELASGGKRDGGIIVLVGETISKIIEHKDLIMAFFQASQTAIEALLKKGPVKTIEMAIDSDSIRIEGANDAQIGRLIGIYEANHPGKIQQITSSPIFEVIGTVSKAEQPLLAERAIEEKEK